jgi:uncharacterized protein
MNEDVSPLKNCPGKVRLFPLPNLVFFPHVIQPLHIFEPRYRVMTSEALASDRLIVLTMLKEGWENDYHGKPAVEAVATMGRIVADQQFEDGRYNLLLRGLSRVRIIGEANHDKPYREADVELLNDQRPVDSKLELDLLKQLAEQMHTWFPTEGQVGEPFKQLLKEDLTLGALCDILCFALPLESQFKQEMLEQLDVMERTRSLLDRMARRFPPDFSSN